jgi:hypothetical protein
MKPLHPDTPKPHHMRFVRELPHGTLPLRNINFRALEPEAKPIDKVIAAIGLIGLFAWALWEYCK